MGTVVLFQFANHPMRVGVAVAITAWLSVPPVKTNRTEPTPADAVASNQGVPETVAPLEGKTIVETGAGLFMVTETPGLVTVAPPGKVATLCRV